VVFEARDSSRAMIAPNGERFMSNAAFPEQKTTDDSPEKEKTEYIRVIDAHRFIKVNEDSPAGTIGSA
jgi:hypothetical protein